MQNFLFKQVISKSKNFIKLLAEFSTHGTVKIPTEIKLLWDLTITMFQVLHLPIFKTL